jgi:hypothetical protein
MNEVRAAKSTTPEARSDPRPRDRFSTLVTTIQSPTLAMLQRSHTLDRLQDSRLLRSGLQGRRPPFLDPALLVALLDAFNCLLSRAMQ